MTLCWSKNVRSLTRLYLPEALTDEEGCCLLGFEACNPAKDFHCFGGFCCFHH